VDGKYFMRFQSENAVCKFLWRTVDEALLIGHDKHCSLA